jgi:hypothetical protein
MGGGMMLNSSNALFEDCNIFLNSSNFYGGGAGIYGGEVHFLNCFFFDNVVNNNSTSAYGGAAYCSGGDPYFNGCTFSANYAGVNANGIGGGVFSTGSDPTFIGCEFYDNHAGTLNFGDGGGYYCLNSDAVIDSCVFLVNQANNMGAGIFCEGATSSMVITNSSFINNLADDDGGAIRIYGCTAQITKCLFASNSAGTFGSAISCISATVVVDRCDFILNPGWDGAAIYSNGINIMNSIFADNSGTNCIYFDGPGIYSLQYCDFFDNANATFAGNIPANLGTLSTINANCDSCDSFYNLFLNPIFSDEQNGDYTLQMISPCIDAGYPGTLFDPDHTRADMGCYPFSQFNPPPFVTIGMYPVNPPITIPGMGGTFNYVVHIRNNEPAPRSFGAEITVTLPTGAIIPILTRNLTLPANGLLTRNMSQFVPATAPVGTYSYNAYVGDFPTALWDSSKFNFEKGWREGLESLEGLGGLEGWIAEGWGEEADSSKFSIQYSVFSISASPNPFNAVTTIQIELPQRSDVKLELYNIKGQLVRTIYSGIQNAGSPKFRFEADNLPSGVYFYKIKAESLESSKKFSSVEKLILLK